MKSNAKIQRQFGGVICADDFLQSMETGQLNGQLLLLGNQLDSAANVRHVMLPCECVFADTSTANSQSAGVG